MDDTAKKALVAKLAAKASAFQNYSPENAKWFTKKIIDHLISKGTTDQDLEAQTKAVIDKAKVAVKKRERKGFNNTDVKYKWFTYSDRTSRVQIIYGLIAMHPEFVGTADPAYFDFIIERRFRSIQRLMYFVNPTKERKIFAYQDENCIGYHLNKDVASYWMDLGIPFILNNKGTGDPVKAVDWIFKVNTLCDKNILPCDPVATILHMDALQEANNKLLLFNQLITEGPHYFKIEHPFSQVGNSPSGNFLLSETIGTLSPGNNVQVEVGIIGDFLLHAVPDYNVSTDSDNRVFALALPCTINQGDQHEDFTVTGANPVTKKITIDSVVNTYPAGAKIYVHAHNYPPFHFLSDSRPDKALFDQSSIKLDDLQVGDHIYVRNHPLYGKFQPEGVWGGEHSFVLEIGSRSINEDLFGTSLKVAGHGLTGTALGLAKEMLNWVNTDLSKYQDVTKKHLQNKQTGKYTAKVNIVSRTANGRTLKYYEYDVPVEYTQFPTQQSNVINFDEEANKVIWSDGFVIAEDVARNDIFSITNITTKDSGAPAPTDGIDVFFLGTAFNTTAGYKLSNWGLRYYNRQISKYETVPLFYPDDLLPTAITFEDLKRVGPFIPMKRDADVFVTRPRVDFSTTYQDFLVAKGAYVKTTP